MHSPSVSYLGTSEPFELQVARGHIAGHKTLFKFGSNSDINGSLETIWSQGGLYVYPASAIQMKVSSSSTADAALGTGARTVFVYGLDANYQEITEVVTLNGQTEVLTAQAFLRVSRAYVLTVGTSETAAGNIYIGTGTVTAGVPATVYAVITLGENQTTMAVWTVPVKHTFYIHRSFFSAASNNSTHTILGKFLIRNQGGVFRNAADVTVTSAAVPYDFEIPLAIPEKTDIEVRAIALSGSNFYVTAAFEGIYIAENP